MTRITEKQLQAVVDRINRTLGTPMAPYSKDADGKYLPCGSAYLLDMAYGGYALHQMMPTGSGERDTLGCGHVTKRELWDRMHTFLTGLDAAKVQS
jgi:hypothetical protein